MRIATYNIWNSDCGMPVRTQQIITQIQLINADILCLQEVKDNEYCTEISESCAYSHVCFFNHINEQEGLAVLSRYPIISGKYIPGAVIIAFSVDGNIISFANLHLSWKSIIDRENEIVNVIKHLSDIDANYSMIAGDFNCFENSSIHRFLLGQQSLHGQEVNSNFYDLATSYAFYNGNLPENTIDFKENPRWKNENTIEINQRFDRILLRNPYPRSFPTLECCKIFGKEISTVSGYAPSDHYGVYVDLCILK